MMLHTRKIYNGVLNNTLQIEEKFDKNFPIYPTIDKIADSWITRIFFAMLYIAFYIVFATSWWMFLLLPIHFLMGPIQGAVVNWAGHKYGYRNFPDEKDKSKNTLFIDFLMLGELFQNNHHHAGARPNFAAKWWELDPVYPIIKFFHYCGMIQLVSIKKHP
jgi:stearoyl-CoA desaturase (delta-9 desaturase)